MSTPAQVDASRDRAWLLAGLGVSILPRFVVEDSLAGVEAGVAAGMRVVGFTGGSHCDATHGERLVRAGASEVVQRMDELGRLLGLR